MDQALELFGAFDQGLAVVREWKRHNPAPRDRAVDSTQDHSVGQFDPRWSGRIDYRLVAIRPPKGLEPSRRMKHGGPGVAFQKLPPARIAKRVKVIGCHPTSMSRFETVLTLRLSQSVP